MTVVCNPKKVGAVIGAPVDVDIKLPVGLTEDMFPLDIEIEVYDMTLSPDASKNTMPVKTGLSIIPLPEKQGKKTFRFIKSIETKAEYDALPTEGTNKVIKTSWLTNMANNGSTVYVYNKYFEIGSDNFINAKSFNGDFTKKSLGITGTETVDYEFDIHAPLQDGMTVTVTLERLVPTQTGSGLTPTGVAGVYTYTPIQSGRQTIHLQTESTVEGTCSVSLTTDDVYGYVDENDTINQVSSLVIPAGHLVTTLDRDFSTTNGYNTILIYAVNPQNTANAEPIAEYSYTRVRTGGTNYNPQYREAHNTNAITLPSGVTTLYVYYQQSADRRYVGSFNAITASGEEVTINFTRWR